jgi:RNA polymerase sigma factor (sigma-70 family)
MHRESAAGAAERKTRDEDRLLILGMLRGDDSSMATIDGWIRRAAMPFRRRLEHQWDDLLQDLRLEVFRLLKEERFRGDSSLRSYLWQVVGHSCLDRIRSARRWRWTDLEEAVTVDAELPPSTSRPPTWNATRDLLMRVLERMPQACRRLWEMIYAGWSYPEMSRRVGVSEGALRVRVLRCRRRAGEVRGELLGKIGGNEKPGSDAKESKG